MRRACELVVVFVSTGKVANKKETLPYVWRPGRTLLHMVKFGHF